MAMLNNQRVTYNLKGPRELEMYVPQIQVDLLKTPT